MQLTEYLNRVRQSIEKLEVFGLTERIDVREEIRPGKQAVLVINVTFLDGASLYVREYLDAKYRLEKVKYAWQFQDSRKQLIFRYDNAPHKPPLGFKNHKHRQQGEAIEADLPRIEDVIDEILTWLLADTSS